ncbi:hypothetical protein B0H10DRAFT_1375354 [Mycena sp. CBHHK59/15]|nr:hypothetical protein B0H10DRAFT_1375354 [Mycena sp. CBHHK59/15]
MRRLAPALRPRHSPRPSEAARASTGALRARVCECAGLCGSSCPSAAAGLGRVFGWEGRWRCPQGQEGDTGASVVRVGADASVHDVHSSFVVFIRHIEGTLCLVGRGDGSGRRDEKTRRYACIHGGRRVLVSTVRARCKIIRGCSCSPPTRGDTDLLSRVPPLAYSVSSREYGGRNPDHIRSPLRSGRHECFRLSGRRSAWVRCRDW